jgi:hypothetical protein
MAIRTGHGAGAGVPRIEVLPADELPKGLPAYAGPASPSDTGPDGRFAGGNSVSVQGGKARAGKTKLAVKLGLTDLSEASEFASYRNAANAFRRAQCTALASSVGGGFCGPAPSSLVATAALQLAWSRYLSDEAALSGDADLALKASKLGNDSRQNLLAAHELCAKEATARDTSTDEYASARAAFQASLLTAK